MNKLYETMPGTPGVYIMKGVAGRVLYVGKAGNLRRRVASYFERPRDARIEALADMIKRIDYKKTDTALEALILEAELIRKYRPPFNVREKDDKSFLYAEISREKFPRVSLVRGRDAAAGKRYGPFTSASSIREALKILRRIFPWSVHDGLRLERSGGSAARPCLDYEIGLCPGTCIGAISRADYMKNVARLKLFFEGKKRVVLRSMEEEMAAAARKLEFERAEKLRRQIFSLRHIRDVALISDPEFAGDGPVSSNAGFRIEGYDISNISGTSAVGSMVVFLDGKPHKEGYRKFKIRTVLRPNDVGMLREVLERRFSRRPPPRRLGKSRGEWPPPDLVLIDGGAAQVNIAKKVLGGHGLRIRVIGIAKGPKRKRNNFIGFVPKGTDKRTLIRVRDEAHRFAVSYHKFLRRRRTFE